MAHFQPAEQAFASFTGALPDLLPEGWRGTGCRPLEIDVGCHKGRFLVEMAQKYPLANFLGVERRHDRVEKARKKISRLGLGNAAVLHGEGLEAISRLPGACADYVHILFPDPWPKRRHKTRRMVRAEFLREVSRILKRHGILRLVTDDPDYAGEVESRAACLREFQRVEDDGREYPPTEFQIKFLADSRQLYCLLFARAN